MAHMGRILGWPRAKSALLAAGIHAVYAYERLAGWHRMVGLSMPEAPRRPRRTAGPALDPEFA